MIILINGAFGVGKTTIANLLVPQLQNSMLYDPEIIGRYIRFLTQEVRQGAEATDDFQDIKMWRSLTVYTAQQLWHHYQLSLVIPMTLVNEHYFQEIMQGLGEIGEPVHHFCLCASAPTIHARLARRGESPKSWTHQQTERCLEAFTSPVFQKFIDTEAQTPTEIAASILHQIQS